MGRGLGGLFPPGLEASEGVASDRVNHTQEVPALAVSLREKSCDYQVPDGRDLYCAAAAPKDGSPGTFCHLSPRSAQALNLIERAAMMA